MNNIIVFYISTIPAGIALFLFFRIRNKVDGVMKKEHSKYSGGINNSIDVFRIFQTVNSSNTLSKTEKRILIRALIYISISWLVGIVLLIYLVFFYFSYK